MNCGRSSSVEWKLPKLQRRVRFPSPAPAPPGHAPGGFVMPTSGPRSSECGRTRYKTRPAHPVRRPTRYKTRPARAARCHFRYKTHPARPKSPNLAHFIHAGRVLSRFHHQQATQGELFTAHPQRHHRHDRNNTPTQHTQPRDEILFAHAPHTAPHNETFTAPARQKQPEFTHFHHAGANFLSQHAPHTHTGATFLSTNASASKRDPNKTVIIFDSVATSRPDRKDIGDGAPVTTR